MLKISASAKVSALLAKVGVDLSASPSFPRVFAECEHCVFPQKNNGRKYIIHIHHKKIEMVELGNNES